MGHYPQCRLSRPSIDITPMASMVPSPRLRTFQPKGRSVLAKSIHNARSDCTEYLAGGRWISTRLLPAAGRQRAGITPNTTLRPARYGQTENLTARGRVSLRAHYGLDMWGLPSARANRYGKPYPPALAPRRMTRGNGNWWNDGVRLTAVCIFRNR